jgi:hypothetical protein
MYWPWYWEVCEGSEGPNGPEGWGGQGVLINFKNIYPSIDIKRVVVLENRRTEEYNERSLKHLSLNSFFMGFFLILKFGIWYSQELRVQMVKWLNS